MTKGRRPTVVPPVDGPHADVLLGYLCGNSLTQSFHRSLLDLIGHDLSGPRRLHTWAAARSGPLQLPASRNMLCQQLLDSPADWLFMLDSDMGFEPDTLTRLLAVADPVQRPVVGGLCFAMREASGDGMGGFHTFPSPTILNWVIHPDGIGRFTGTDHYPVNTMIRVGATGAACLLIHRNALEAVGGDWFTPYPSDDGVDQGEDISFCGRLRNLDIPLWMHTGVRTTHFKSVWLAESDFWQSRVAPPATERVDVVVPHIPRPQNIPTLMRSLRATTALATAWWVCDPDDVAGQEIVRAEGGRVLLEPGTFAHKCNFAFSHIEDPAPWLLLVGDDVRFRPGWLDQALDAANLWNASVVATNDLLNERVLRGEHATHPLIRRSYVDQVGASWDGPGVLCHEGYGHNFVDDEWTWAAKMRSVFQAALGSHVEHLHPIGGKVEDDAVYRKERESFERDQALFQRRLRSALAQPAVTETVRLLDPLGEPATTAAGS